MMETVRDILERKGSGVHTIGPEETVFEAVRRMDTAEVGALVVVEGERMVGIITERDYARKVVLKGRVSRETAVREIMSRRVTHVGPADTAERCMALMTERNIRHLPVLEARRLVGIVSMRDLLVSAAERNRFILEQLWKGAGERG